MPSHQYPLYSSKGDQTQAAILLPTPNLAKLGRKKLRVSAPASSSEAAGRCTHSASKIINEQLPLPIENISNVQASISRRNGPHPSVESGYPTTNIPADNSNQNQTRCEIIQECLAFWLFIVG